MTEFIDLREPIIPGVIDPTSDSASQTSLLFDVLSHHEANHQSIDVGRIGWKRQPHLYLANSLAQVVELEAVSEQDVQNTVLDAARYTRVRTQSGQLLVSARTADTDEAPFNPATQVPQRILDALASMSFTLDLLAASFTQLRADQIGTAENDLYNQWISHTMQVKSTPPNKTGGR